jgi:hypothetical protein
MILPALRILAIFICWFFALAMALENFGLYAWEWYGRHTLHTASRFAPEGLRE